MAEVRSRSSFESMVAVSMADRPNDPAAAFFLLGARFFAFAIRQG
jgi:hypothetical protein